MMSDVLTYDDLYRASEELQQLVGSPLQSVHGPSSFRFVLGFRLPGESRNLVLDLTPNQPFIVSTSSTKIKGPKTVTPILNFLKAHYVGKTLAQLEIAQKPNRTLKMVFKGGGGLCEMIFKCFPHGQHLVLLADGKFVNLPLRSKPSTPEEEVTFIETERHDGWDFNIFLARKFGIERDNEGRAGEKTPTSYKLKLIKKLEKSMRSLEEGVLKSKGDDEAKIGVLQKEAQDLRQNSSGGARIQAIFTEIKKIKRKNLLSATRRNDLEVQLEKIKKLPDDEPGPIPSIAGKKKGDTNIFSGTRIRLDDSFELWVGRSDWQNDDLLRLASSHELWIHLRDYPGAHGIIRCPKKTEPTQAQIEFACCVVAGFSAKKKSPFSEGERLDFIVTPRKFVKKPKGAPAGRVVVEREMVRRVAYRTVKFDVI